MLCFGMDSAEAHAYFAGTSSIGDCQDGSIKISLRKACSHGKIIKMAGLVSRI